MPTLQAGKLEATTKRIFQGAGSSEKEAGLISRYLVTANLMGHDSHGVIRIPQYLADVQRGNCVPDADLEVVQETPATVVLNANWGYGQTAATRAMEMAMDKAGTQAVSSVGIHNCNHIGRLGEYPAMAAERGMIGITTVNGHGAGAIVAPFGGAEGRMVTNPISVGIPTGQGGPIVLDIATSVAAEGKVRVRRNQGQPVPMGWLVNNQGVPTTDPNDLYTTPRGAILPLGGLSEGHKGYGLALIIEILSGALTRAGCAQPNHSRSGNGVFILVLNISAFTPLEEFKREVDTFTTYVKSAKPMEGFSEILLPGEIESRQVEARRANGIAVDDETWSQIKSSAAEYGVTVN